MNKKKIALLAGGYSGEYVISIESAKVAERNIDAALFDVYKIIVSKNHWTFTDPAGESQEVDKNDFSIRLQGKKIIFDAVLMIIHGTPGEDGKLQGYFDMIGLPYTCCDASTSSLTFNKRYTVATAAFAGIRVAPSVHLFKDVAYKVDDLLGQLKLPVFVKPNNGGSSIGMSKVTEAKDLAPAIEKAFKEDDQVLAEQMIHGREFTIGVLSTGEEITVLPICEVIAKKGFFDYEAKYTTGMAEEIIPARVEETIADVLRATARKAYQVFHCRGVARIDFIWNEADNQPYMLEINTTPGQSENSILPKMLKAHGWSMRDFYTLQLENALCETSATGVAANP